MPDQWSDTLFERHAELCKVFANAKRLKILDLLQEGELSVGAIADETDIPQPTVSQHLRKMRDQGVVTKREVGVENRYSITDDRIVDGMETIRTVLVDRLADESVVTKRSE